MLVLRVSLSTLVVVVVSGAVLWRLGGVPNRQWITTREASGQRPGSHDALVSEDGSIRLQPRDLGTDGAPYWIIRVPAKISSGHSDVTGDLFARLIGELMDRNKVFDPDVELALTTDVG